MDDIKSLAGKKKKEMEEFIVAQDSTISVLKRENDVLNKKVSQLESMLITQSTAVSPEELICVEQIELIKQKSASRELSLDEVKRLDILIKNLRLIKDQSTEAIDHTDYRNVKEVELVAIARTSKEEDN